MGKVIETLIDKTVDCDNVDIIRGDKVKIIECVGNLGLTGLKGKVYNIKHCQLDDKEWIALSMQDIEGTIIEMRNYEFKKEIG